MLLAIEKETRYKPAKGSERSFNIVKDKRFDTKRVVRDHRAK